MRIAYVTETFLPKVDGISTTLCKLLDHLALHGHTSLMLAPEGAPEQYAQTPIIGLPGFAVPFYPELHLAHPLNDARRHLAEFAPDVVHVVNPGVFGAAALFQARELGLPVVASYHTDLPGYARRAGMEPLGNLLWSYFRWIHNQADLNLTPSWFTKREVEEQGFENVKVWSRGVDCERYTPAKRDRTMRHFLSDGHPEAPLLLYVGRLAFEKRVEWLLPVLQAVPEARLAVIGDGPKRAELEQAFAGANTVFTGYLKGEDLAIAYASADIFAFPSANETFGVVVLEAMASGLPIVAPDSGGLVDHVIDQENGLLFPADDQQAFIDAIQRLVEDPAWVVQMGANARRHALENDWATIFDRLLADYAELVREKTAEQNVETPIAQAISTSETETHEALLPVTGVGMDSTVPAKQPPIPPHPTDR